MDGLRPLFQSMVRVLSELKKLFVQGQKRKNDFAALHKVRWISTNPLSPRQGGIYESLLKQTKRALPVVIKNQVLSWKDMATAFPEVKSLVKVGPLDIHQVIQMIVRTNSKSPSSWSRFPLCSSRTVRKSTSPRKRFAFAQNIAQQFWRRFVREYVPTLMLRTKYKTKGRQVNVNKQ